MTKWTSKHYQRIINKVRASNLTVYECFPVLRKSKCHSRGQRSFSLWLKVRGQRTVNRSTVIPVGVFVSYYVLHDVMSTNWIRAFLFCDMTWRPAGSGGKLRNVWSHASELLNFPDSWLEGPHLTKLLHVARNRTKSFRLLLSNNFYLL